MAEINISFAFFVPFLLEGLAFTVFNDSYIRRGHRKTLLLIVGLCASLVVQKYKNPPSVKF